MKKILIIIVICIMSISCDRNAYLDYYIQNNCEQSIIVNAEIGHDYRVSQKTIDTIHPNSQKSIYQRVKLWKFYKKNIPTVLLEMSVIKDGKNINFNPVDTARWQFSQTGEYNYEAILPINPEDFE